MPPLRNVSSWDARISHFIQIPREDLNGVDAGQIRTGKTDRSAGSETSALERKAGTQKNK
jgi:hypothetical protein